MKRPFKKVAIITGGCGLLGWEHALALNELNYKIIILDNSQKELKKRVIENKKFHYKFDIIKCDITKKIKLFQIIKSIFKKYKNIDVLINNASIDYVPKKNSKTNNNFLNFDFNRWIKELDVGLTGAFLCCQAVGKYMLINKSGIIINIGSDLSVIAPNQSLYSHLKTIKPITYSVIKSGLHGLTLYLSSLWASKGIRVNTLSPGGVYNNQDKRFVKKLKKVIPMKRMADKKEYRGTIKFLCSADSKYMTGQNIIIDGGRTII